MTRVERFTNQASTTLNGAINDTTTSITVTDGSVFPSEGDYRLAIEDEIVTVTSRATNVLTVVRGTDGTTAASHSDAEDIFIIVAAESLEGYFTDLPNWFALTNTKDDWNQRNQLLNKAGVTLTTADFTNSLGSSFIDDSWGAMRMELIALPALTLKIAHKTAPTTPYTLTTRMIMTDPSTNGVSGNKCGIFLRESSTGRLLVAHMRHQDNISLATYANATTFNAQVNGFKHWHRHDIWLRLTNDGTTMEGFASFDGVLFRSIGTETVGTYLTPNQLGWFGENRDQNDHQFMVHSWLEE